MHLDLPVTTIDGVGPTLAKRLAMLHIKTIRDVLYSYPFRYEDFSMQKPIAELKEGDEVSVAVTLELIANKRTKRRRMILTEAVVSDGTDQLRVVWFNQPFLVKSLHVGDKLLLSGKITRDAFGMQMVSPAHEKQTHGDAATTPGIMSIYPLVAGLTQKQRQKLAAACAKYADEIGEWIPTLLLERTSLEPLQKAIREIHAPSSLAEAENAAERLKFDELFVLQLRAERARQEVQSHRAEALPFHESETKAFVASLPFTLTNDQKIAAWEILQDLGKTAPMNRLLEGDVGSGKTVVAAIAAHNAILSGAQVAVMAPTDVLAAQHYESFTSLLGDSYTVALLTRTKFEISNIPIPVASQKGKKQFVQERLADGRIHLVIGTHALLTEAVQFHHLGLVVVDEQHRFGVGQRKALKEKSGNPETSPHFLSMTATPIPRSFALTLYGELDLSMIKQLPSGRKPIKTKLVDSRRRSDAYTFIQAQVKAGRQVFVICPLISKTDTEGNVNGFDERKSVMDEYETLSKNIFPELRVAYLHGKMPTKEKDETMVAFALGKIDVLVSTSVVEVGVNIPNASVMMIEGAEHFGLAQLHQFRGRVGRSDHQSFCFVFTDSQSTDVQERLRMFESTTDGFALAEYDLDRRGPGEVYGASQSGMMQFQLASMHDTDLIKRARELARDVDFATHPELLEKIAAFEQQVHLE